MSADLQVTLLEERQRWCSTVRGRDFLPQHRLDAIMKGEAVGRLLRSYGMEPHELHEVEKVVQGGKRTFAILLAIGRGNEIRTFVERERYTQSNLDAKLPISRSVLREYIGPVGAADFDLRQWEFIAPIFRGTHSYMAAETILPFTLEERLNKEKEGSFGAIYKVKLPRSHVEALATTGEEVSAR